MFPPLARIPRSGLILAAGFLALGLFLMAAVLFSVRRQSDDVLLRRALEVELDLGDLLSALQDAEIGQRGYLLTDDESFLTPYRAASGQIDTLMGQVGKSVRGDPDQFGTFAAMRALVGEKRAEMARTLALRAEGDVAGAMSLVKGKTGVALMDRIRHLVGQMDAEQDRLVAARQAAVREIGLVTATSTAVSLVLMGLVALAALNEVRRRTRLAGFMPVEVASRLADGDSDLRHGRTGPATVAFVDIRGSTALAEGLLPAALSSLLTGFRRSISAAARDQGGMVDKFIGDGALVVFGALDGDARAPARALAFARDLLARVSSEPGGETALRIGIGIHHGDVFCGIVGDDDRREFTVLGDTVNVASRIEEATKAFATDLLVSEVVLRLAGADLAGWRKVSREPLRGRHEPIALYTPRPGEEPVRNLELGGGDHDIPIWSQSSELTPK